MISPLELQLTDPSLSYPCVICGLPTNSHIFRCPACRLERFRDGVEWMNYNIHVSNPDNTTTTYCMVPRFDRRYNVQCWQRATCGKLVVEGAWRLRLYYYCDTHRPNNTVPLDQLMGTAS